MSYLTAPRKRTTKETDEYHHDSLLKMKLHGDYFVRQKDMPDTDISLSYSWINNAYFRSETEKPTMCRAGTGTSYQIY